MDNDWVYLRIFSWTFVAAAIISFPLFLFGDRAIGGVLARFLGVSVLGLGLDLLLASLRFLPKRLRFFLIAQLNLALVAFLVYLGGPPFYPLLACNALAIMVECSSGRPLTIIPTTVFAWVFSSLALLGRQGWRFEAEIVLLLFVTTLIIALALVLGLFSWRRERELRQRLTETVADLTKARAEQEEQLAKMRETNLLLEERYAETYALYLIEQYIAAELDLDKILPKVTDVLLGLLGGRSCSIMRVDEEGSCLRQVAVSGPNGEELSFPLAEHPLARCWAENRALSHADLSEEEWAFWRARGTNGLLCQPLGTKTERVGLILVEYDYLPKSLEEHRDLLALVAGQLSLALENAYLYQEVRLMANHDALTGLANRHFFREKLTEEMATAGEERPLSAVIIDLDHFKRVNDEYGHEAGDEVLRFMARLLLEEAGEEATVARYGGEEFVILLPGRSSAEAAVMAEGIRQKLKAASCRWEGHEIRITASFGVASFPEQARDRRTLLRLADRALYEAKRERDKVVVAGQGDAGL
ncbi:MAG: sensor domain-containing diguanylate cyclase [Firmicutes bacterium]|nr:sensor domain-containing diguanylate cyclase [Bacillota bacterium]